MKRNTLLAIAAFSIALAVVLGAMGAHALKELLSPKHLAAFSTGVKYQMYGSFGLAIIALAKDYLSPKMANVAAWFMLTGTVFFAGSIYLLTTTEVTGIENMSFLGPVTPLGGILLITSWILVGVAALMKRP